ncbi:hypothetical protein [Liquorilactobacillus nagelii]|uniref:hypothetical protein n=1 Tax=Liquorilactobacillus nagelii TaxID=82688 RepID=UPI001CC8F9DF|nr:hypothetical protein [Liquorilactobacillus nagelii]ULQ49040.1 hypothetical protein J6864_08730 [Liquorilactobacillus nagelii]
MKYEDIKKAKVGDKVVVIGIVKNIDALDGSYHYRVELPNECGGTTKSLRSNDILAKLLDFTDRKVKFTEAEKKEFDKLLKRHPGADLNDLLNTIYDYSKTYSALHKRLFRNTNGIVDRKKQFEFARALEKPSLIEVVREKKYWIKLADGYLVNVMGDWLTLKNKKDGDIFTQFEIDRLQERFKAIDLNKCKEEVEE